MAADMATAAKASLLGQRPGQGYPGHLVGRFVWTEGDPHPFHCFLMARGTVRIAAAPAAALLHVTASDRYLLWVNGEYLGRGPSRGDPRWQPYDTYDLAGKLRTGRNVIAILAYHYGCRNNYSRGARAGLFAQLETVDAGGAAAAWGTDAAWKVRRAAAWSSDVPLTNENLGPIEVYDGAADPLDWMGTGFDDGAWALAAVIPDGQSPWTYLEARRTPRPVESEAFPAAVERCGEAMELTRMVPISSVAERLAMEPHFDLRYARIDRPEALLERGGSGALFHGAAYAAGDPCDKGVRSAFVILDFGRQLFGFPRVEMEGPRGAVVEMTYTPELIGGRALPQAGGVRYGDRYLLRDGEQSWQVFEYKQFRYLQIVVRSPEHPVRIRSVSLVSYDYPAEPRGSFACSDRVLTSLWKACADTTLLQMEDTIVCDAFRERMGWGGDGAHGLYALWACFGDIPLSETHFRLLFRGQMVDGMLRWAYPGTDHRGDTEPEARVAAVYDNPLTIPQHALVVAAMLAGDYHQYFGKRELFEELYPALALLLSWCARHADDSGLLYHLPMWNWADWAPTDMRGANFETNAIYYRLLTASAEVAAFLARETDARTWSSRAEEVRASLRRLHWSPERRLYADSWFDGTRSPRFTQVANGMALLWGIATPEQVPDIARRVVDPGTEVYQATPLFHYYVSEGLIRAGYAAEALAQLASYYGPMVSASDAPTIWEGWVPFVRERGANFGRLHGNGELNSLTHSGGVGPCWTLSKHVLGVSPVGPGFARARVAPCPGGLAWARGTFPSMRGDIAVAWTSSSGTFTLEVSLPDDLETELCVPRSAGRDLVVLHNGSEVARVASGARAAAGAVVTDAWVGVSVTGGTHRVEGRSVAARA